MSMAGHSRRTYVVAGEIIPATRIELAEVEATMDIEILEREALKLPAEERARLARELLSSLDELPEAEVDRLWLQEAGRRAGQIDAGEVVLVSGDEVDRKAKALLR